MAIIPARGGSKRIPRKNIKSFLGQPVIKYSIDAAVEAGLFNEVMVSTDDKEIAELAVELGASVPFLRSAKTAGDYAATADVIDEVLREYINRGYRFDYFCCIYPTAPFITAEKLIEGFRLLNESGADSLTPVASFNYPIQRALKIEDGRLLRMWPEYELSRSQDLVPTYHDVGQFYWHRVASFLNRNDKVDHVNIPMIIPEMEMQDIDTEEDWKVAEMKFRLTKLSKLSID